MQVCGILMAQYTITGFDASAHLSEETNNASWNAPLGVLMSVGVSAVFGFFFLIALLFSIQNFDTTVDSDVGQPVTQILIDVFGDKGAIALMTLVILCVWHAGLFSMTSNSRMMFGFARDRKTILIYSFLFQNLHSERLSLETEELDKISLLTPASSPCPEYPLNHSTLTLETPRRPPPFLQ